MPALHKRSRKLRIGLAALAVVVAIVVAGSIRHPADSAQGAALTTPCTHGGPAATHLRLGTYNIDGGLGLDGTRDLGRAADYVRDCDLVALNEVHGAALFSSVDQAQELGQRTGLSWLFIPAEKRWWRDSFGNGLLTSAPVQGWTREPLVGHSNHSYKSLFTAQVQWGAKPIRVMITHIAHDDHEAQLATALSAFLNLQSPCVLMGDLNTDQNDAQMQHLLAVRGVIDAIGQSSHGARHIDWIILRGLHVLGAGIQPPGVSDHPFYWVDVAEDPSKAQSSQ